MKNLNIEQRIENLKGKYDHYEVVGDNNNDLIVFLDNVSIDGALPNPFADNPWDAQGWVEVSADFIAAFREVEDENEDLMWIEVDEISDSEWGKVEYIVIEDTKAN